MGLGRSFNSRNFICKASYSNNRPLRVLPCFITILTVSVAWMSPIIPGKIPSTPPSAQDGTIPGGGGSGYKSR